MLSPVHDMRQEKAELQKLPPFNPRFRFILLATAGMLLAACASNPRPASTTQTFYRAYKLSELSPAIAHKVVEAERRYHVEEPAAAITPPAYRAQPSPFSFELRRAKRNVWVSVFVLIDERGAPVVCEVIDATDDDVVREAGPVMRAARYRPATIVGEPVPCAFVFTSSGGYIPVSP